MNIIDISRLEYKDMTYVSKQLSLTVNYLLDSTVRDPACDVSWLKVKERIEYKLLFLTYKVLTTSQPTYLSKLVTVQSPRSTRSSSVVTIPPTSLSLKITNRSF